MDLLKSVAYLTRVRSTAKDSKGGVLTAKYIFTEVHLLKAKSVVMVCSNGLMDVITLEIF